MKKFNFIPERQLSETKESEGGIFTVSINKAGLMVPKRDYVQTYELNGKYLRYYVDKEKQTIGWAIIAGDTNLEELSDARQVKIYEGGSAVMSVKRLLTALNYKITDSLKNLPIKIYKSTMIANEIHYVELPPKEAVVILNGEEVTPTKEE